MGLAVGLLLSVSNSTSASQNGGKDLPLGVCRSYISSSFPRHGWWKRFAEEEEQEPPPLNNLTKWQVAFSRLMAVLLASEDTSHEEGDGLAAHLHTILQLHHDLGGSRWLKYDMKYWEWAASKGVRVWNHLNMSIYGRYLLQPPEVADSSMPGPSYSSIQICYCLTSEVWPAQGG